MLESCRYCGRIHDKKHVCKEKEEILKRRSMERTEKNRPLYDFHRSAVWKRKSVQIRERDNYCCQICSRNLYNPQRTFETEGIEVHHIIPLIEDYDKRLDDDNLVSLCRRHHEDAEKNDIPRELLIEIAKEQEALERIV